MGCCSSPRTTVAGVAVLHLVGALGCIGLCSYLLTLEGPKLELVLTQSWTLLTTMHLPVVVDADGNVVTNRNRSGSEVILVSGTDHRDDEPMGRSAYEIRLTDEPEKDDVSGEREFVPDIDESSDARVLDVIDKRTGIFLQEDEENEDFLDENEPNTLLYLNNNASGSVDNETVRSNEDFYGYLPLNFSDHDVGNGASNLSFSRENYSLAENDLNVTEIPIVEDEYEMFANNSASLGGNEEVNNLTTILDPHVLYVDVPDHKVTNISDIQDTFSSNRPEGNGNNMELTTPRILRSEEESFPTSSEFMSVSVTRRSAVTPTFNTLFTELSSVGPNLIVSESPSNVSTDSLINAVHGSSSGGTNGFDSSSPAPDGYVVTSTSTTPDNERSNSSFDDTELLPTAQPLRSGDQPRFSRMHHSNNFSLEDDNYSGDEPFTFTIPPIVTTTGFISAVLTSTNPADPETDPELSSLLFELTAGACVLGLLVYFILCVIAATLLLSAAIWRLEELMLPWLVLEWVSLLSAIAVVGVLTWRLLEEGVLLWCWWLVVLGTAVVVVLILCLVLVMEAYQTLPYEITYDAPDAYEMQYITHKHLWATAK
ncbi:uncharacterized protein LOC108674939 isoform X2 [Hyalella azteca]|uniref:Uncharacterized protein LOC108674939 isoform X2 n=1 Tax=Hyalella azteca TaxID=294128 RepID=A0A8B7NZZ4_HYAAZ|nr:uncharacterized protein LOC108674939 isoform X2 [Hyalella azteca]